MANLEVQPGWPAARQLDRDEFASGGPNGNLNEHAKVFLARTEYLQQQKANKSEIVQGVFEFGTYAEFNAAKASLPLNCTVIINEVNNIGTSWGQGSNRWNGTTLTKSAYDPLTQAKADATAKANAAEANANALTNSYVAKITSIIQPVVVDPNGKCPFWIQDGKINFAAIHADAVKLIKDQMGTIDPPKNNNVTNAAYPIISDGASLTQWKAKASKIKSAVTQQLRFLITGDSWTEHNTITGELLTMLRTSYGEAGSGWINLGSENNQLDGISLAMSAGWQYNDLNLGSVFPYGSGPDGFIRTSVAAGDTMTISNMTKGDKLTIFFGKTDGTFKYSINGGAETTVTATSTGAAVQSKLITLTDPVSELVITTLTGTIAMFGFHLRKSTGSGVELTKIGNGGTTGQDYLKIGPTAQANFADYLKPDVVVIILGTNDYRLGKSIANYKAGISAIIDGYRTNNPECGVILIAPARSNYTPLIPLSDYRDAIYEVAQTKKAEFYNMYDDWNTYAVENAVQQWDDAAHVSKSGAYRLSKKLYRNFLEM